MLRANLWNKSVSRVELDQRARDARLRLERIERLLALRAAPTDSWLRRVLWLFSFGRSGEGSRARRIGRTMSNQRPRLPQSQDGWVEECGSFCRASDLHVRSARLAVAGISADTVVPLPEPLQGVRWYDLLSGLEYAPTACFGARQLFTGLSAAVLVPYETAAR
jgi:hypothetical protein